MKHGGDLSEATALYGGGTEDWLDLSTGINPEPWPVASHLLTDALRRLPAQADEEALIEIARQIYQVPKAAGIIAAPGVQALIQWLPHLACEGDVAILGPTYSEHAQSWQRAGRTFIEISDLQDLPQTIRHVVAVNPNNPDGHIALPADLIACAEELKRRGGWLVMDESFADIDPSIGCANLCTDLPMIALRSFGKFFGLPGLRLGFLIADRQTVSLFKAALGPWSVSAPALIIGAAALADRAWADAARAKLALMAQRLDDVLIGAGLKIIGGTALFRLVHHAHANALHERLAQKQIWCRRFDGFDDRLRFGLPRNDQELFRFKDALSSR
jgi:cobalamin biosynthetic protein CobC